MGLGALPTYTYLQVLYNVATQQDVGAGGRIRALCLEGAFAALATDVAAAAGISVAAPLVLDQPLEDGQHLHGALVVILM